MLFATRLANARWITFSIFVVLMVAATSGKTPSSIPFEKPKTQYRRVTKSPTASPAPSEKISVKPSSVSTESPHLHPTLKNDKVLGPAKPFGFGTLTPTVSSVPSSPSLTPLEAKTENPTISAPTISIAPVLKIPPTEKPTIPAADTALFTTNTPTVAPTNKPTIPAADTALFTTMTPTVAPTNKPTETTSGATAILAVGEGKGNETTSNNSQNALNDKRKYIFAAMLTAGVALLLVLAVARNRTVRLQESNRFSTVKNKRQGSFPTISDGNPFRERMPQQIRQKSVTVETATQFDDFIFPGDGLPYASEDITPVVSNMKPNFVQRQYNNTTECTHRGSSYQNGFKKSSYFENPFPIDELMAPPIKGAPRGNSLSTAMDQNIDQNTFTIGHTHWTDEEIRSIGLDDEGSKKSAEFGSTARSSVYASLRSTYDSDIEHSSKSEPSWDSSKERNLKCEQKNEASDRIVSVPVVDIVLSDTNNSNQEGSNSNEGMDDDGTGESSSSSSYTRSSCDEFTESSSSQTRSTTYAKSASTGSYNSSQQSSRSSSISSPRFRRRYQLNPINADSSDSLDTPNWRHRDASGRLGRSPVADRNSMSLPPMPLRSRPYL